MKKRRSKKDPHASREARKYSNPIVSREYLLELLRDRAVPTSDQALARYLGLRDDDRREALRRRLAAMERDGQLVRNRRGQYCLVNSRDLIVGRVMGHPDGFGFLRPDEGGEDLFLSPRQMRSLIHNDRAVVRVSGVDRRGRREGALVEVIERNTQQVVGRLHREGGVAFVVPDDRRIHHDILIPDDASGKAEHGQIVVAELVEQPSAKGRPLGRIAEVLGDHMAPGMEVDIAIRTHGLPTAWPEEVEAEVAGLKPEVPKRLFNGRVDLRKTPLVTIDGADSRDFDDAVFCEAQSNGWRLLVAIADVSAYVEPGTALDTEARARGNSVYFPDQVIAMLPEILSNGLCSLNPDVNRLCMVCEMEVNREGKVTGSRFFDGVMRSHARLTYDEVAEVLVARKPDTRKRYKKIVPHLEALYDLFQALLKARLKRGAIDFDTTETRILFGEDRKIEAIVPLLRNDAHRLIEECMIAANVSAAQFLQRHRMPTLYRVHEGPKAEKVTDLRTFLGELGLHLGGKEKPEPRHYSELLTQIRERPDAHMIQTVLLRSLAQAVYTPDNNGHFGLALDPYAHFTSPIRRYPDLLVHRAIRHCLKKRKPDEFEYSHARLLLEGEHCSATERRADEATRDVVDWLKCEYMMDRVGEEFPGTITGVTSFGLFVELDEIYVSGMIHVTTLRRDYYHFDPVGHLLKGERSGQVYRLADRIVVKVMRVDLDDRKIDLEPAGSSGAREKSEGREKSGGRRRKQSRRGK